MEDPIKIIHKYKNNNGYIQYLVYIYVGSLVSKDIMTILKSFIDKDFYTTLNTLDKSDYKKIEMKYGEYWYEYFFISHHINNMKKIIDKDSKKKKSLEHKYGGEWYNKHIKKEKKSKVAYSFAANYYNELPENKKKITRKVEPSFITQQPEDKILPPSDLIEKDKSMIRSDLTGGQDADDIINEVVEEEVEDDEKEPPITEQDIDDNIEEDFNLEELSNIYQVQDVDNMKTINETSKLITNALNDTKWEKTTEKLEDNFNTSFDTLSFDTNLEDVYNKNYITDQFIFKDDTIKTMRNKITLSIPISKKFNKNIRLLPETQYFWSEYNYNNSIDMVMLGQKWIRRNELLKIDVKPNDNLKIYEKLRNNLSYLKESFGYKIKRENDETNIIRFYEDYMTMNEIYMIDIYNNLGLNYDADPTEKRNLYDVYINIYYPMISSDRFNMIVDLLNGVNTKEITLIESQFNGIRNDVIIETKIEETVEKTKLLLKKQKKEVTKNFIILSIIHININDPKNITGTTTDSKYNLYRIFDNFIVDDTYPFIQYQSTDSASSDYKIFTKSDKLEKPELFHKWFENAPYGISFKIKLKNTSKMEDKYISINFHENGRINYKVTWREEDEALIEDIIATYDYVKDLLSKINGENNKIKIMIPSDDKFKYAFINTIQKFNIPEKFKIDHNDLSDFCRYFFPYIAMVVEPKKRVSKTKENVNETSKYGTYLRYKRISKYDNRIKLQLRILYFLRNFDINEKEIIEEISKQFNITIEDAVKEMEYVKDKYSKVIKRSSKMSKKMKVLPKSKPPGIGIDIQGRDRENYKIRITGARDKLQLDEIVQFMDVLIYLYVETYLYKNKDYQQLKDMLKKLTNIATRRNKVSTIVDYDMSIKTVKNIINLDKDRLGFKPEKGESQYTRMCQNSGLNNRRRPEITPNNLIDKLIKDGYKMNKETGYYEKEVEIKIKGKKYITKLKAVKLAKKNDNTFNYYTCDPSTHKENYYIGFLDRGNNPNDLCMPCCFKKNQLTANNIKKKNNFLKCVGKTIKNDKKIVSTSSLGDKIYILQDTNKIQDARYIFLPKYLDIFFNKLFNNDNKIKNHYLLESKSGYYFKYTIKHDYYFFLSAIANIYNKPIDNIIESVVDFLNKDKNDIYFTYLNNGDIAEAFKNKDQFIDYIKTSNYLEYDMIGELCAIPGVITQKGIIYYIFNKHTTIIKKSLEKDEIKEKYFLECLNSENNYQFEEDRDIVILIKEGKYYFPIYRVKKDEKKDKKFSLVTKYSLDPEYKDMLNELRKYHSNSCMNTLLNQINTTTNLICKNVINKIKNNDIKIVKQFIDDRKKCKYIELDNGLVIPTIPSGISFEYPFQNIKSKRSPWIDYSETIKLLQLLERRLHLDYKPLTVYYDSKKNENINITSILLANNLSIPIKNEIINENKIKRLTLSIVFKPLEDMIDNMIAEYNDILIYDDRSKRVKEHNYMNESYNLYRLELSLFLSNNPTIKEMIVNIVTNNKILKNDKRNELRSILFNIIDKKLAKEYKLTNNVKTKDTMAIITKKIPDLSNYVINNIRDYCNINKTKDKCNANLQCTWKNDSCKLMLLDNLIPDFVNKLVEELIENSIKYKEIIQEGSYYVSDIVNYSQYTYRDNIKIIKSNNFNVNKLMSELFGKDKIPIIGKRQISKLYTNIIEEQPNIIEVGDKLLQEIIPNNDTIIRAYINSYYWIKNPLYDIESRNLGYINDLQTNLCYIFKANIIDYIVNNINNIKSDISKFFKNDFNSGDSLFDSTLNKFRKTSFNTNGKLELFILSYLINHPIVVYDNFLIVKYIFLNGFVEVNSENIKKFTSDKYFDKTIFLKFNYDSNNTIPNKIYSIYHY